MNLSERVYYYMPDDKAVDQSNRGKYNCSESIYRAIVDHYKLDVSEDAKVSMAAFGGGLFMGDACGLLVGGYAALANMYAAKESPHADDKLKSVCKEWYNRFKLEFNTVDCCEMKPTTGGCSGHGKTAGKIFEELIKDLGFSK